MASRDIYAQTFDEDVPQHDRSPYPDCNGRVTTHVYETVCEDCGLVSTIVTIIATIVGILQLRAGQFPDWRFRYIAIVSQVSQQPDQLPDDKSTTSPP